MMKYTTRILAVLFMLLTAISCQLSSSTNKSPSNFSESDLIGIWQARYNTGNGVEVLVFREDKTYLQIYQDSTGILYTSDANGWEIKHDPTGRTFVHLSHGVWFPLGSKIAQLKGKDSFLKDTPHYFYDHQANKTVTMLDELILEVIPSSNSKGVSLLQFAYDIDSTADRFNPINK